jgi:hypothetical protein
LSCLARVCRVLTPSKSDLTICADTIAYVQHGLDAGDVRVSLGRRDGRVTGDLGHRAGNGHAGPINFTARRG